LDAALVKLTRVEALPAAAGVLEDEGGLGFRCTDDDLEGVGWGSAGAAAASFAPVGALWILACERDKVPDARFAVASACGRDDFR